MYRKLITALLLLVVQQTSSVGQSVIATSGSHEVYEGAPRYTGSHIDLNAKSDEDLIALTDHPNATVRIDAFGALIVRRHPACFDILLKHLSDVDEVGIKGGCYAASAMAGDIMIDLYTPHLKNTDGVNQGMVLDSALLYSGTGSKPVLRSKDHLLLTIQPQETFYLRIRTLAMEKNTNAIVALAKYRNPADKLFYISLLKNGNKELTTALYALSYFPDADFLPYLERIYKKSLKKDEPDYLLELFRTVAAYRNAQSLAFLQKVYQKHKHKTGPYLYAILTATNEHADPLYAGLEAEVKKAL